MSNLAKRLGEYGVLTFASLGWWLLHSLQSQRIQLGAVRKILLIPHPGIGNLILLTPALHAIRQQFPDSRISVVVETEGAAEVLHATGGLVDETVLFDFANKSLGEIRRFCTEYGARDFDLALSCGRFPHAFMAWLMGARTRIGHTYRLGFHRHSGFLLTTAVRLDQRKHEVEQYLDLLKPIGIEVARPEIFFSLSADDVEKAEGLLQAELPDVTTRPLIGLHIGSNENLAVKRWPAESFAALLERIHTDYPSIVFVLVGGENEVAYTQKFVDGCGVPVINFTGRLGLKETAALIRQCGVFISNDSGPMHIAAAVKTPVVGIFGPTVYWKNAPWGDPRRCIVVRKDMPCSPCYVPYSAQLSCTDPRCLRELTVDEVYKKVKPLLKEYCCS